MGVVGASLWYVYTPSISSIYSKYLFIKKTKKKMYSLIKLGQIFDLIMVFRSRIKNNEKSDISSLFPCVKRRFHFVSGKRSFVSSPDSTDNNENHPRTIPRFRIISFPILFSLLLKVILQKTFTCKVSFSNPIKSVFFFFFFFLIK